MPLILLFHASLYDFSEQPRWHLAEYGKAPEEVYFHILILTIMPTLYLEKILSWNHNELRLLRRLDLLFMPLLVGVFGFERGLTEALSVAELLDLYEPFQHSELLDLGQILLLFVIKLYVPFKIIELFYLFVQRLQFTQILSAPKLHYLFSVNIFLS